MKWDHNAFEHPEAQYRVHPFWFWNGEMEEEQIRRQIAEMHAQGVGGFFICPRQGLQIPYLSEAWFDKVRFAVSEAAAYGMQVWLYDEYPYPSGMAGGEVTLDFPEAKQRQLVHHHAVAHEGEVVRMQLPWGRILLAQAVRRDTEGNREWHISVNLRSCIGNIQTDQVYQETGLTSYNRKRFFTYQTAFRLIWEVPEGDWEIIVFQEKEIDDFKYYGNFVDPCHRKAMSHFIQLTHERYKAAVGEHFESGVIQGMFSDEIAPLGRLPWSPQLPRYFHERCGYSLIESLPALLYRDAPNAAVIRYDYFQSLHLLLRESYHKQVHDWCEAAGIQYAAEVPGVRMTTHLYSHMPGGDSAHEKIGRPLSWILERYGQRLRDNPKMVSSLARQLGRSRNMIECFHSVGWSMTLQDAKWMIDRMAAMGTNFYNFHAFFYTIGGLTKHDAPPSQFLQNPYWKHFRQLGDYTGRLSYLMSTGAAMIHIAVLDPTTTFWSLMGNPLHGFDYSGEHEEERVQLNQLIQDWMRITAELLQQRRDYDHLDPELLVEAHVANGVIEIGIARYDVLILPPMLNLEAAAWKQIKRLVAAGGTVISMGMLPHIAIQPGSPAGDEAADFFGTACQNGQSGEKRGNACFLPYEVETESGHALPLRQLSQLLDELLPEVVSWDMAEESTALLMQTRQLSAGEFMVFLSNQEGERCEGQLKIDSEQLHLRYSVGLSEDQDNILIVERLNLETGQREVLPYTALEGQWCIPLTLAPYEAHAVRFLLQLRVAGGSQEDEVAGAEAEAAHQIVLSSEGPWRIEALQPNNLRIGQFQVQASNEHGDFLDMAQASVKPFIDLAAAFAEQHTLPLQFEQVFGTPKKASIAYPFQCRYTAAFELSKALPECLLFMDRAAISGAWVMEINGHILTRDRFISAEITDHTNIACDVAELLCSGLNELVITVDITQDEHGIVDPLYLRGEFGVQFHDEGAASLVPELHVAERIGPEPQPLYPHFAGEMSYTRMFWLDQAETEMHRFELEFEHWSVQDVTEVRVNGHSLGVRCWSPYRWQGEGSRLRPGDNEIEVCVTNTLIGLLEGMYFDGKEHRLKDAVLRQS
ncbi:hypothetical protein GCM10008014_36900 [Paenibacillus silvae]|uniref:Glycoside hydrolase n=1 Tax=Paenibacillus silvae TaxID=1325358 RepID=A0ABQ1ZFG5_9BACL|nr:glycosyl hydrolase [Paenibacillus silvae]GGH61446.1 hypothetical protein GCM10008014_36900 [Paenibacillus silvae]